MTLLLPLGQHLLPLHLQLHLQLLQLRGRAGARGAGCRSCRTPHPGQLRQQLRYRVHRLPARRRRRSGRRGGNGCGGGQAREARGRRWRLIWIVHVRSPPSSGSAAHASAPHSADARRTRHAPCAAVAPSPRRIQERYEVPGPCCDPSTPGATPTPAKNAASAPRAAAATAAVLVLKS